MANQAVQTFLNKIVATQGQFYIRLHQFHWYVKGSNFFALHEKFEEMYDETTENLDEVAERLLAIGGEPYSTLQEFIEHSVLSENPEDKYLSQEDMVKAVIKDLQTIVTSLDEGIALTDEAGDNPSNDLLIGMKESAEKNIWMLEAYLGDAVDA
ncbi:DNA starvation/stationary phase protection protein [Suicoccus acidiformans]|uniref:DNA starvation/stationary phase protection protein n=1 Tax=Suicoccus acidiformans TaxID=2036206 RepID=A0A347WK76_9LACT|nr:DNA starvation/stationary phase protection protein [Suicoccus acidiformans]AXY25483.1 DNA starvation/stationary phase protection protein [Suicoccus acidiformans]